MTIFCSMPAISVSIEYNHISWLARVLYCNFNSTKCIANLHYVFAFYLLSFNG